MIHQDVALQHKTYQHLRGALLGLVFGVQAKGSFDLRCSFMPSRRVLITIDAPKSYFLSKMTLPAAYVLDRENVEAGGDNWTNMPNGTGPFRLKEYVKNERIVLESNELYYYGPPILDTVLLDLDVSQRITSYENDELDVINVGLPDLEVIEGSENLSNELTVAPPDLSISYIAFNTSMPPFDDIKFRQAVGQQRSQPE